MQRSQESRPMTIIRIGVDTAKHIFQVHGVDENEPGSGHCQERVSSFSDPTGIADHCVLGPRNCAEL
jgi:hypothetical protein